jgi:hypothetical protein
MAALTLCASLFVLMAAAFVRPELVVEPGMAQLAALGLVCAATVTLMFSLQASFSNRPGVDYAVRLALGALAMFILFSPSEALSGMACIPAALIIAYWIMRCRQDAPAFTAASRG